MLKICKRCKISKSLECFNKAGKYYQSCCKPCQYEYKKEWALNNPEKYRMSKFKERTNIDATEFERVNAMHSCQICGISQKSLHIDHDHKTGVIRGALCTNCNHGLGKFRDDKELLKSAIKYLDHYRQNIN